MAHITPRIENQMQTNMETTMGTTVEEFGT